MSTAEAITVLAPSVTLFTVLLGAFLAYRTQIRLKTFELLLERRDGALTVVEQRIQFYHDAKHELDSGERDGPSVGRLRRTEFHDSLVLYNRCRSASFGPTADVLLDSYWAIQNELLLGGPVDIETLQSNVGRKLNILVAFFGCAHGRITKEIESLSLSYFERAKRALGFKEKLKLARHPKEDGPEPKSGGRPVARALESNTGNRSNGDLVADSKPARKQDGAVLLETESPSAEEVRIANDQSQQS